MRRCALITLLFLTPILFFILEGLLVTSGVVSELPIEFVGAVLAAFCTLIMGLLWWRQERTKERSS